MSCGGRKKREHALFFCILQGRKEKEGKKGRKKDIFSCRACEKKEKPEISVLIKNPHQGSGLGRREKKRAFSMQGEGDRIRGGGRGEGKKGGGETFSTEGG